MIELLREEKVPEFLNFCNGSINGAVIYTRLKAYGINSSDALFWFSENEDKKINGVYSMADGVFTYHADSTADEEEIMMFSAVMGAREITKKGTFTLTYGGNAETGTAEDITGENVRKIFPVIFEDDISRDSYFSFWYTDISHKIRHSLIHGKAVFIDGECVSAALTSGESEDTAVISSVATLKKYRRLGHGKNAVLSLAGELNKKVCLMTDSEATARWYIKMGFK